MTSPPTSPSPPRRAAWGLSLLLLSAGIAGGAAALREGPAPAAPLRARLAPCHLDGLAEQALCGALEVAEDRRMPQGRTIPLQVAVLPALRRRAEPDPLFLLAGGPGQGARSYARLAGRFFREVRKRRDVVLLDLRGTGGSRPLDCPRPADELAELAGDEPVDAAACLAGLDADVRLYTSEHAMADLDEVRAALGYERVNLWGGSYGTRAALVYARLFPGRLRAAVLDGAAPFELKFPLANAAGAQRAFDLLARDCAADPACRRAFPRLRGQLAAVLDRLAAGPVHAELRHPRTGEPRSVPVTRQLFASGLRVALYTPAHASLIPYAVDRAERGDFSPFAALLFEGAAWSTETMALGLTLAVLCSEDVPRIAEAEARRATAGTFAGRSEIDAWRRMCAAWRPGAPPPRVGEVLPSAAPALILSGELDPVTPPRWGEAMARHFPRGRHVVVPGAGHNTSFTGCVPDLIARFLERGTAGGLDTSCVRATRRPPFVLGTAGTAP